MESEQGVAAESGQSSAVSHENTSATMSSSVSTSGKNKRVELIFTYTVPVGPNTGPNTGPENLHSIIDSGWTTAGQVQLLKLNRPKDSMFWIWYNPNNPEEYVIRIPNASYGMYVAGAAMMAVGGYYTAKEQGALPALL